MSYGAKQSSTFVGDALGNVQSRPRPSGVEGVIEDIVNNTRRIDRLSDQLRGTLRSLYGFEEPPIPALPGSQEGLSLSLVNVIARQSEAITRHEQLIEVLVVGGNR
jgi:hypothetical protein